MSLCNRMFVCFSSFKKIQLILGRTCWVAAAFSPYPRPLRNNLTFCYRHRPPAIPYSEKLKCHMLRMLPGQTTSGETGSRCIFINNSWLFCYFLGLFKEASYDFMSWLLHSSMLYMFCTIADMFLLVSDSFSLTPIVLYRILFILTFFDVVFIG